MTRRRVAALGALMSVFCCAVLGGATTAAAQQPAAAAAIRGQILPPPPQGVVATVVLTELRTAVSRQAQADVDGRFSFTNIPPGEVSLVVTVPGFTEWRRELLRLEVGQILRVDVALGGTQVRETVEVRSGSTAIDRVTSTVGTVVTADEIAALPLNGRNFLELAFLTPGSAPAPTFDPTKAQSVVISSGGQAGRGGNITIDGMDNNDDVVGGPLMNFPQEGVGEFQVATNRFSAELGRSASSIVNVITRAGSNVAAGSGSFFLRDRRLQALPATVDPSLAGDPPFKRHHLSGSFGGPIRTDRIFGFGVMEYRNQDGGVLIGVRDPVARTIGRSFAPAPLDDVLVNGRVDWRGQVRDHLMVRYSGQWQDDVAASTLERAIGSASARQRSDNTFHAAFGAWTRLLSPTTVSTLTVSYSDFDNRIGPVQPGPQLTYPSLQGGASFRVPQATQQGRLQVSEALTMSRGAHEWRIGGELQRVDSRLDLGVFRDGRLELAEDFPAFDRNRDGAVNDDDLLIEVTLRSGKPDQDLALPDVDNVHLAGYVQDDWRLHQNLTLNLGLRYEIDTDVTNISRVDELNPIVLPFVTNERTRDTNNIAPRVGFNWSPGGRTSVRGGYGIYYDRVVLQIQTLERGLDGRALPIEVRAGNVFFIDQATGTFAPGAPTVSNPFTGFILPGEGASGINIIDPHLQNPKVQQASIGFERELGRYEVLRVDVVHNRGTQFLIGRTVGTVFNPVVGGPDRVVNLESSARTQYNGLLVEFERRYAGRFAARAGYTLSQSWNHANDDQIPFGSGPIDPNDIEREWANAPNDRRHRLTLSGMLDLGAGFQVAGLLTLSSAVPMDILLPDGSSRIPSLARNAGGRSITSAAELNAAIADVNAAGGVRGQLLPSVSSAARFGDSFSSLDLRVSKQIVAGAVRIDAMAEVFNLFNTENILGTGTVNYSGFANALVRDSTDPTSPGFMTSSRFGVPVSTAGGVFGSGGPLAVQLGVRFVF
jgi:outer membrane receptor protein involved in Fe transport